MSSKYACQALFQKLQTTKMNIEKTVGLTYRIFKDHNCTNPCQSSSSLSTLAFFVYVVLFMPFCNVLSCYFYVLLHFLQYPPFEFLERMSRETAI